MMEGIPTTVVVWTILYTSYSGEISDLTRGFLAGLRPVKLVANPGDGMYVLQLVRTQKNKRNTVITPETTRNVSGGTFYMQ